MAAVNQRTFGSLDEASDEELSLASIDHPRLVGLHRYWDAKRGGRDMPSRDDLDPVEMAPYLGHVFLIDVESNPRRFRFRLIGTEIVLSYGRELTGKYTDAVTPPSYREMIERHYAQAVDERRPLAHRMTFREDRGKRHDLVRLTLPLSDDGASVNMLLLCSAFGPDLRRFRERQRSVFVSRP